MDTFQAAGRIIGKKGENIKHIREKCQPGVSHIF